MKLHVRKITLAAGIAAAFAATSAFAYDPAVAISADGSLQVSAMNYSSTVGSSNQAGAANNVLNHASGNIGVNTAAGNGNQQSNTTALSVTNGKVAGAYSNAAQLTLLNSASYLFSSNTAGAGAYNVLNNASGNIGLNAAAGDNNQQHNDLTIAVSTKGDAEYARADVDAFQGGFNPGLEDFGPLELGGTTFIETTNHAGIGTDVLNHSSGNIAVNSAAGANNQQMNQTAIAVSDDHLSEVALATVNVGQVLAANANGSFCNTHNTAELGTNDLNYASGNIGVNIAAGANNQQFNGLAIAAATH